MVNSVIAGRINQGRRGVVSTIRNLNKYIVSGNGVSITVTARNGKMAIAIAESRNEQIGSSAMASLIGNVSFTFNQYKN